MSGKSTDPEVESSGGFRRSSVIRRVSVVVVSSRSFESYWLVAGVRLATGVVGRGVTNRSAEDSRVVDPTVCATFWVRGPKDGNWGGRNRVSSLSRGSLVGP